MGNKQSFSGNQNPLISGTFTGLSAFPQDIYRPPTPAYPSMSYPRSSNSPYKWLRVGEVVPPFGRQDIRYPIRGRVIIPGSLYKYQVVVGNRLFPVQETHKLLDGDVIDVLGFGTPQIRWRVRTGNNYWDRIAIWR